MVKIMKKTIILGMLALMCLACKTTDERFAPAPRPIYESGVLTVSLSDTAVIPQGRALSAWKLKDTTCYFYTSSSEGEKVDFFLNPGQKTPTQLAYALYPDVKVDSLHNGVFYLRLKERQTAAVDASPDCIYAGRISANTAELEKACGIIRFTVGCEGAACCDLTTSLTNPVAGKARIKMSEEITMTKESGNNTNTVSLVGNLQKGSTYEVAVIPGTFKFSFGFKTEVGMPIGGDDVEGEFTVGVGEEANIGVIGDKLPPIVPGNRIADAEGYSGYETIPNNWDEGNCISMLLPGENEKYELISGAGTSSATFHGNEMSDWQALGLVPCDENAETDGETVSTELSPVQIVTPGVPYKFALATSNMTTGHMDFRNAAALLRFEIAEGDIAEIVFRGNAHEILSGRVQLLWNGGEPSYTVVDGADSISVKPSGAATFAPGKYYAAVLPQTLSAGYTVMTKSVAGKNTGMSYSGAPTALVRSEVLNLGKVPDFKVGPNVIRALADGFTGDETIAAAWPMGSTFSVISAGKNERYALVLGAGEALGTFSGEELADKTYYGVSPYDPAATCNAGTFTATLSANQQVLEGTANGFAVASLNEASSNLEFRNVAALLKFEIKGDNVGEVIITGNAGETLAGKVSVSWNGGSPAYTVVEGSERISIKPAGGNAAFTPGTYYAAVLPQNFSNGITVTMKPYKFATNDVVKFEYLPSDLEYKCRGSFNLDRSSVKNIGVIDGSNLWNYSTTVRLAALRGSDKNHGLYLDLSTGRAFYAIGAYPYSANCDLTMITNGQNGIAPSSIKAAAGYTNETNLGKFGTPTENDEIGNDAWAVKSDNTFCYVSANELTDAQYNALATVAEVKAIYDAHSADAVNTYYNGNCVTNANRVAANKYLVIKTTSETEGTGYGIFKFVGLAGGTWYIEMNYKFGLE